jgi:hypothetical protein
VKKPGWSIAFVCLATIIPAIAHAQDAKPRATVGLYYFDGWSGKTNEIHITKLLETGYADRKRAQSSFHPRCGHLLGAGAGG